MEEFKLQLKAAVPGMMRYNLALLGHFRAAETIVQDCVEKALDGHLRWEKNKPIGPWLYSILHKCYQDYEPPADTNGVDAGLAEYIMSTDPSVQNNQQVHDLMESINKLPNEPKEILLMVIIGGLEYRHISEILDISLAKTMSQLHLARKLLRKYTNESESAMRIPNSSKLNKN